MRLRNCFRILDFIKIVMFAIVLSFSFIAMPSPSFAQSGAYPHLTPQKPEAKTYAAPSIKVKPSKKTSSSKIAVPSLKGIIFISSYKELNPGGVSIKDVSVRNLPLLNTPSFINYIRTYLNKPLTFGDIRNITGRIDRIYKSRNHPFIDAAAPPQNVSSGTLQVVVTEYRVSKITVSGSRYFSDNYILSYSGISKNEPLSSSSLVSDMDWLNSNPFIRTSAVLSPGKSPGAMDVNLVSKDVYPLRVFAGYDNQGIPSLGMNEWDAGFNYGNLFGLGQMLSYELSQSFNAKYRAQSLSYDAPFPWKGKLDLSSSYSTASPYINNYFNELGRNFTLGLYYKQELPYYDNPILAIKQNLGIGYELKTTNTNLAFGGLQVFQGVAQLDQFPVLYSLTEQDRYGITSLNNRFVISPGDMNADNSDASFNSIYHGTRSKYIYDNLLLSRKELLPFNSNIVSSLTFQDASRNLLYTEQLSAGGLYSAIGYSPDTATGSRGIILNETLNLPPLNIAPVFQGTVPYYKNNPLFVNLGLFYDYADLSGVNNVSSSTGLPDTAVLASAGVKLGMDIGSHGNLIFAAGRRLRKLPYGAYGSGLTADVELNLWM